MRKILFLLSAIMVLLLGLAFFYLRQNPELLMDRLIRKQVAQFNNQASAYLKQPGINIYTVGTATPIPGERAQTCTAIFIDGHFFLFDVGYGSVGKMERMGLPLDQLEAVFITHWHSDHFIDLPYLINRSWQLGRHKDLQIYGPEGMDSILQHIQGVLEIENQHRVNHHGNKIMNPAFSGAHSNVIFMEKNGSKVVYEKNGIQILAFDVCHEPVSPDFGYRINYQSKSVVLSGDTKKCENVIKNAQGADLLIHEAMLMDVMKRIGQIQKEAGNIRLGKIMTDVLEYHTSPLEAAEVAAEAGVKELVLHHLGPTPDNFLIKRLYLKGLEDYFQGPVHLADDGDQFTIE